MARPAQVPFGEPLDADVERLRSLLEWTSDWIWEIDADCRYVYSNPRVADILGYAPEEVIGRTPFDFMPASEAQRVRDHLVDVFHRRIPIARLENINIRKDGRTVVLETSAVPVIDAQGFFRGYRGIDRDITESHRAQTAVAEARQFLEHRVRERTRALAIANTRLESMLAAHQRVVAELRRAERSKSHFLAAASHDLRQPYQAALLLIEALRVRVNDPAERMLAERAVEALEAGREVLDVLARAAALDAGIVTVRQKASSVADLIDGPVREQTAVAAAKGVALRRVPSSLPVLTDAGLARLAVAQYISNALHHARPSRVLVGCRRHGPKARIEVWDNGCGLAERELETVFDDFVQFNNPERDRRKGLGLGLGIVSRVGRLLGHEVGAESWPGRGSLFYITVPLADPDAQSRSSHHTGV